MESTLRQRISQIKEICVREKLSVSDVVDIASESGDYVSERTVYRIMDKNSESLKFRDHTIITIYEALINKYGDMSDVQDAEVLKRMIAERDKTIDRIIIQAEKREEEYEHHDQIYADRKSVYEKALELLREQIAFKDKEIERQAALIEKLINKVVE